jgi:protein-S-isoprenylcysteine O-methyltransferase Ste14
LEQTLTEVPSKSSSRHLGLQYSLFSFFAASELGYLKGLCSTSDSSFLLREFCFGWAIYVLGKYFTVRVQVREKSRLITHGPYSRIRHPSYTGTLLTVLGIAIAVGTWFGAFFALSLKLIAYRYRINVEEQALQEAFGPEWDDYKKRTWKLIPGY